MNQPYTVLIAAPELVPTLKHAHLDQGELLVFSDRDIAQALDAIHERLPNVIAIDQRFAESSRGAAFINRLKSDPALRACEVRVLRPGGGYVVAPGPAASDVSQPASGGEALDRRGTRRGLRYKISGPLEVFIDGNPATLIDLSNHGAQVVSQAVLKPNQRVRMSMSDEHGTTRFNASIAWAVFEIPPQVSPRYRAGVEFIDADARVISGYCLKYQVG